LRGFFEDVNLAPRSSARQQSNRTYGELSGQLSVWYYPRLPMAI
jgi:hypothetical protein